MKLPNYLNPLWWFMFFYNMRVFHFGFVGALTFVIHIGLTALLEHFVFGESGWYIGYSIALVVAILFNFAMHTIITYKTKKHHLQRFEVFVVYTLCINFLQNMAVKYFTGAFGIAYRYFIMAGVIILQSFVTFVIFKFWLFKEAREVKSES